MRPTSAAARLLTFKARTIRSSSAIHNVDSTCTPTIVDVQYAQRTDCRQAVPKTSPRYPGRLVQTAPKYSLCSAVESCSSRVCHMLTASSRRARKTHMPFRSENLCRRSAHTRNASLVTKIVESSCGACLRRDAFVDVEHERSAAKPWHRCRI